MAIESAAAVTMQKMERARQVRSRLKAHSSRSRLGSGLGEDGEVLSALEISEIELGSSGRSRSSSGESLGASLTRQRPLRSRLQAEAKPQAKVVYSVTQLIAKAMFDRHSGGDGDPNPTPNPNPKPQPQPDQRLLGSYAVMRQSTMELGLGLGMGLGLGSNPTC